MKVQLAGEDILLLPEKALFWPNEKVLAFSDVHLGKPESLQALGIPIPSGAHKEDLARMEKLIAETGAAKVYILGDLIHQKNSWTPEIQEDLFNFFNVPRGADWTLLVGNHERGSKVFLEKLKINIVEGNLHHGPFIFSHGHDSADSGGDKFTIQGHVHPAIHLREGSIRLRLPCFLLEKNSLVMPSFGILTGGFEISKKKTNRVFAVAGDEVFEVAP